MKLIFILFGYVIFHHQFMLKFRLPYTCHTSMYKVRTYRRFIVPDTFLLRVSLNATRLRWFYSFCAFHYFYLFLYLYVMPMHITYYTKIYFPRFWDDMLFWQYLRPASGATEICENSSSDNLSQCIDQSLCKR